MTCQHQNATTDGEPEPAKVKLLEGHVYQPYKCLDCGEKFYRIIRTEGGCTHQNAAPVREEMRKTECGKVIPTKIFKCPDCNTEFSIR